MGKLRIVGRMHHDAVRDRWMLLAPERGLVLSDTARAIVELCDGTRDESEIISALRVRFAGESIDGDVRDLLAALRAKALLEET